MVKLPALRHWRIQRALTMRDLADHAGVSLNTILRLEQDGDAHLSTVRKLANALSIEPSQLYTSHDAGGT